MAKLCVEYIDADTVRDLASRLKTPEKAYYFVRDKIKYVKDPYDVWQTPEYTLKKMSGDCEDKANLLASILIAMGYDAWIRIGLVTAYTEHFKHVRRGTFYHAWVMLRDGADWIQLDPSCMNCKFGQIAFTVSKIIIDYNDKIIYIHDKKEARKYVIK